MSDEHPVVKSIRFSAEQWLHVEEAARAFQMEPAVMIRRLIVKSLKDLAPEVQKRLAGSNPELF